MTPTQGRRLLERYLKTTNQAALAKRLDVAQPTVCRWVSGASRPKPYLRDLLFAIAGIPARSWLSVSEVAAVKRASAPVKAERRAGTAA